MVDPILFYYCDTVSGTSKHRWPPNVHSPLSGVSYVIVFGIG